MACQSVACSQLTEAILAEMEFRIGCATTLIVPLVEANSSFSSTLMVIISALASECTGKLAVAPVEILRGLASRLASYTGKPCIRLQIEVHTECNLAPIQDACLLSMLRVAADCDEVPPEVLILVQELAQQAGKHIRNVRANFNCKFQISPRFFFSGVISL